VVAETFLVAWRRIDDVPLGSGTRPWLFGVARNTIANLHRGSRRRLALANRLRETLSTSSPPPEPPDTTLASAFGQLSDGDQEILRLSAWEELSHDEISQVLKISRGAVRVRLHRARRRLTAAMTEHETGAGRQKRPAPNRHVPDGRAMARLGDQEA
jgi:RNA polymerase sigma factor (sigma-70 family)